MPSQTHTEAAGFPITPTQAHVFTAFSSVALFIAIELILLCLSTFKRYTGAYFFSLLISSSALIVNTVGIILFFFAPVTPYLSVTIILLGWYSMITGHSIVLWSRLHLVLHRPRLLRAILYLIISNAFLIQIPVTVLLYGAVTPAPQLNQKFVNGYYVIERIQLVVFCLQEMLLSVIYIVETTKLLRLRPQRAHRIILVQLLAINIVIVFLDVVVVVFQYAGLYALQVAFKPVAYGIKLRLEYAILGRLVEVATGGAPDGGRNEIGDVRESAQALNASWPGMGNINGNGDDSGSGMNGFRSNSDFGRPVVGGKELGHRLS
ncbi:hypothetical protein BJY04DRAFT_219070 [Aspergillus karnatakaensis]|uniref:uncharacterized protein n=1 Tax=Aspergillus karnatakaensis TaxID=1810916 RepID=UPI003CCD0CD7